MMIIENHIKKTSTDTSFLGFILFCLGFSIPFSGSFNSICVITLFFYSYKWFSVSEYSNFIKRRFYLPFLFATLFFIQILGILYSSNPASAMSYVIRNIVFLAMPITFINIAKVIDSKKIQLAVFGLLFSVLLILLSIYVNIFYKIFTQNLGFNSLLTYFVRVQFVQEGLVQIHPPYLGLMVVFSIVVVSQIRFVLNQWVNLSLRAIIILFFTAALYGIASFMSILLFLVLCIFYGYHSIRAKNTKSIIVICSALFIFVSLAAYVNSKNTLKDFPGRSLLGRIEWSFFKEKGDTSRPHNWKSVALVVKDNPIFGVGSDGGLEELQKSRSEKSESYRNKHNAHNQFLETLLRHGCIGLILYFSSLLIIISNAVKTKNILYCSFIFVFTIASLTESYLVRQIGICFFVFYSLLFNTYWNFKGEKP